MLLVFLAISTAGGVVYAVLRDDVSTGLTLSTYVVGFVGVLTAIWGAGEQLGVEKPDSYSYSFDTVYKYEVAEDADKVI